MRREAFGHTIFSEAGDRHGGVDKTVFGNEKVERVFVEEEVQGRDLTNLWEYVSEPLEL